MKQKYSVLLIIGLFMFLVAAAAAGFTLLRPRMQSSVSSKVSIGALYPASQNGWYYVFVRPDAYYKIQGSPIRFSGTHFMPGERVAISADGMNTRTVVADSSGSFTTSRMIVPYGVGMRTYTFTGASSRTAFPVEITVGSGNPWIVLSNYYAPAGTAITVSGHQFGGNENVRVAFGGVDRGSAMTDQEGNFSLVISVPSGSPSQSTITATGEVTHMSTSQPFSVAK